MINILETFVRYLYSYCRSKQYVEMYEIYYLADSSSSLFLSEKLTSCFGFWVGTNRFRRLTTFGLLMTVSVIMEMLQAHRY